MERPARLCAAMSCNTETKDRDKLTKCIRPYLMSMERHEVKASRTGRDMHQQQLWPVQAPGLEQQKCATKANTTKHLTWEETSIGTFKLHQFGKEKGLDCKYELYHWVIVKSGESQRFGAALKWNEIEMKDKTPLKGLLDYCVEAGTRFQRFSEPKLEVCCSEHNGLWLKHPYIFPWTLTGKLSLF